MAKEFKGLRGFLNNREPVQCHSASRNNVKEVELKRDVMSKRVAKSINDPIVLASALVNEM